MIYFTSDLNLDHEKILDYVKRPFTSVDDMNETLINNWNATVNDYDDVYILGGLIFGKKNFCKRTKTMLTRLNGKKHLLMGINDPGKVAEYADCEIEVITKDKGKGKEKLSIYNLQDLVCISKPAAFFKKYIPDFKENAESFMQLESIGVLKTFPHKYLCGHIYATFKKYRNFINVGVDVNGYKPISLTEIYNLFKN